MNICIPDSSHLDIDWRVTHISQRVLQRSKFMVHVISQWLVVEGDTLKDNVPLIQTTTAFI